MFDRKTRKHSTARETIKSSPQEIEMKGSLLGEDFTKTSEKTTQKVQNLTTPRDAQNLVDVHSSNLTNQASNLRYSTRNLRNSTGLVVFSKGFLSILQNQNQNQNLNFPSESESVEEDIFRQYHCECGKIHNTIRQYQQCCNKVKTTESAQVKTAKYWGSIFLWVMFVLLVI